MVNFCNWRSYRDPSAPDAKLAIYPFKRVFQVIGESFDARLFRRRGAGVKMRAFVLLWKVARTRL
jgi:hypothetical protein